jgi:phosphonate transport system substrate-binding protein
MIVKSRRTFLAGAMFVASAVVLGAAASGQEANPAKLRVALLPDENAATIIQNAQPLKVYLEGALKKEIELIVTTDYSSMIEAMRFNRIDVAYFGPLSYVLAKSKAPGIEAFAAGVSKGSPTYKSVIIAPAGGPVKTLADIKGKTMAFGDNASTSSHLIPRAILSKNGLQSETDYKPAYLGAHDAVARAVQAGQVQAGGLSQEILKGLTAKGTIDGSKIAVLAESDPIPNYPLVLQSSLEPALKSAIKKAFLDLKDAAILKTFRAEGFVETDDKAYDVLRETAKVLNLDLTKVKG